MPGTRGDLVLVNSEPDMRLVPGEPDLPVGVRLAPCARGARPVHGAPDLCLVLREPDLPVGT